MTKHNPLQFKIGNIHNTFDLLLCWYGQLSKPRTFFNGDGLTNKDNSKRKDRIPNRMAIILFAGIILGLVLLKTWFKCSTGIISLDNENDMMMIDWNAIFISIRCDLFDACLILCSASLGALLGYEVQRHETGKENDMQFEQ